MMDVVHLTIIEGKKYLLTMIDPYTKLVEAFPLTAIRGEEISEVLYEQIIPPTLGG